MSQLNVSIPPQLKSWIEHRVAEGRYSSASDYVRDLVRRDQESEPDNVEWVRQMVAEGLASGRLNRDPREVLEEIIAEYPADRG